VTPRILDALTLATSGRWPESAARKDGPNGSPSFAKGASAPLAAPMLGTSTLGAPWASVGALVGSRQNKTPRALPPSLDVSRFVRARASAAAKRFTTGGQGSGRHAQTSVANSRFPLQSGHSTRRWPQKGDRPPKLGHTSPLASGWQRRVGDEATGFVAMCFKEVEPVTLRSGTRRSPFPTRPRPGARLPRGRALAKCGWDRRGPPTRGCLAGNSNPA